MKVLGKLMGDDSINAVKQEIKFFMEKSYQISLGYVGSIIAVLAIVKMDVIKPLSQFLTITEKSTICIAILLINATYLTLASACIFATLKRGYFILLLDSQSDDFKINNYQYWEMFVREPNPPLLRIKFLNMLVWNVDNYHMMPLFMFIIISSTFATYYGLETSAGVLDYAMLIILSILHIIPMFCLISNAILNVKCRKQVEILKEKK